MSEKLTTIGFDADDTLWHNEMFFQLTQQRFADLLSDFADPDPLQDALLAAERRNLGRYGFGVKGFVLSMIETAIQVTDGKVDTSVIRDLIAAGQDMLDHPIHLLPHARDTVEKLAGHYRLMVITKGDLLDQERKLAQSGLGDLFEAVEIVSDKTTAVYLEIFKRHNSPVDQSMMIGNSLLSDVVPVLAAGGWGVYVPHALSCGLEQAAKPEGYSRFREIPDLGRLQGVLDRLEGTPPSTHS